MSSTMRALRMRSATTANLFNQDQAELRGVGGEQIGAKHQPQIEALGKHHHFVSVVSRPRGVEQQPGVFFVGVPEQLVSTLIALQRYRERGGRKERREEEGKKRMKSRG